MSSRLNWVRTPLFRNTSLRVRGWADPIRTTGDCAMVHSVQCAMEWRLCIVQWGLRTNKVKALLLLQTGGRFKQMFKLFDAHILFVYTDKKLLVCIVNLYFW
jgi:hypothetical protein